MKISILTSLLFQEVEEIHGKDRIVWGGAERYLYDLCVHLTSQGHQVDIYQSIKDSKPDDQQTGNIVRQFAGCTVVGLAGTDDWKHNTNARLNMIFNETSRGYDLAIYFATFLCWPHAANNSISISHGIFWDFAFHGVTDLSKYDKDEFFRRQMYGFTAPSVCVAVDTNVKKVIAAMNPGEEKNIITVYNYVDTEKFTPKEKDWDEMRVLYPRRLTMVRGSNDFINASQQLKNLKFIAVGQATEEKSEKQAEMMSAGTNIEFRSEPMSKMQYIYQDSDISVIPTRASEGLSLSLLESMSCGLPVVTTNVGGLGDAVIPGYNSLIYDPHRGGLPESIEELANNEEMRKKFGRRNREIAIESFDIYRWKEHWDKIVAAF